MNSLGVHRPLLCLRLLVSALLLGTVLPPPLAACFNEYDTVGASKHAAELMARLKDDRTPDYWQKRRDQLRGELSKSGGDFHIKNDLAVALSHTGEVPEALRLFQEIEADQPGLYATASNLGTAYELHGEDEQALEWIRRGIERNPESHEGTEWLHVRILEAKIAIKHDSNWIRTHSIVVPMLAAEGDLPREIYNGHYYVLGNRGEKLDAGRIKSAIIHQLHERLQFVPPPDAVVGSLLLELTTLVQYEQKGIFVAEPVLDLAGDYLRDLPVEHPLRQKLSSFQHQALDEKKMLRIKNLPPSVALLCVSVFVIVAGFATIRFFWRRFHHQPLSA